LVFAHFARRGTRFGGQYAIPIAAFDPKT